MKNQIFLLFMITGLLVSCNKEDDSYSGTLGNLDISQVDFITNEYSEVAMYLHAAPEALIESEMIDVILIDDSGHEVDMLGSLYDNGDYKYSNDDIAGDHVFSGSLTISIPSEGNFSIVAKANTQSGRSIKSNKVEINAYNKDGLESQKQVNEVFKASKDLLRTYISHGYSFEQAITGVAEDLNQRSGINKALRVGSSGYIEVTLANNTTSMIAIYDADNPVKGGGSKPQRGEPTRKIGKVVAANVNTFRDVNPFAPGNRNVLIYSPHETLFKDGAEVKEIYEDADCGEFNVTLLTGTKADLEALKGLSKYGTIYISSHGLAGKILSTGEKITSYHWGDNEFQALWKAKKITPSISLTVDGTEVIEGDHIWLVTYNWFRDHLGSLPNSVVFLNACESTMNPELSETFLKAGASCVFGFSASVHNHYGKIWGKQWAKEMAQDGYESGHVSVIGNEDLLNGGKVQIKGRSDISYSLEFNNGDFEHELREWTTAGDGRAVSALGSESAPQGSVMGLISTGLGKTTTSGSLMQSFIITDETELTLRYNLHSEEFLEYIGSKYQDEFAISIIDKSGYEKVIYRKTIDDIAYDFGATGQDPGQLISTTTDLGHQGVYKTGWQTISFPISQYQNRCITLKIYCQDVGDSIYDTAVLLDGITIK